MPHTEAVVDLAAIAANVATLKSNTAAELMAVVKADGYGHGMVAAARAALAGGASWLGVAMLDEALALRAAGITEPVLAWLWTPRETEALRAALAAGVDISVASQQALDLVVAAAAELGSAARVHLKIDTGLSRNGCTAADWPQLAGRHRQGRRHRGDRDHRHLEPLRLRRLAGPSDASPARSSGSAPRWTPPAATGWCPQLRHLANSAGTVTLPQCHFDLVRPGMAIYGLSPVPEQGDFGLVPAMTLRTSIAGVKRVRPARGSATATSTSPSARPRLALVPVGYADGVPRAATNIGPVSIGGSRYTVSGRVCMDQFVVDVGDAEVSAGDEVVLFGPGTGGEPTAQDWADVLDTIHYEIVTRIGPRVPRSYPGGAA